MSINVTDEVSKHSEETALVTTKQGGSQQHYEVKPGNKETFFAEIQKPVLVCAQGKE